MHAQGPDGKYTKAKCLDEPWLRNSLRSVIFGRLRNNFWSILASVWTLTEQSCAYISRFNLLTFENVQSFRYKRQTGKVSTKKRCDDERHHVFGLECRMLQAWLLHRAMRSWQWVNLFEMRINNKRKKYNIINLYLIFGRYCKPRLWEKKRDIYTNNINN